MNYRNWPWWLPWFGWRPLDEYECQELGFNMNYKWEILAFEWLGFGFSMMVRHWIEDEHDEHEEF